MARRRIGQERLAIGGLVPRGSPSLDEMSALMNWAEVDGLLAGISASAKGERCWPPLALFRALLLAMWHDLSDVRLAEALNDCGSFRQFCGFAAHEPTPERTAFVRFHAELVRRRLDRVVFGAITRQLGSRGVVVRTGTLVDATPWGGAEALARLQAHNAEVRRVRARIEKVFGTAKRSYGLHRMRWLGLARAGLQIWLTAMADNLRRSWRLLTAVPA